MTLITETPVFWPKTIVIVGNLVQNDTGIVRMPEPAIRAEIELILLQASVTPAF